MADDLVDRLLAQTGLHVGHSEQTPQEIETVARIMRGRSANPTASCRCTTPQTSAWSTDRHRPPRRNCSPCRRGLQARPS